MHIKTFLLSVFLCLFLSLSLSLFLSLFLSLSLFNVKSPCVLMYVYDLKVDSI